MKKEYIKSKIQNLRRADGLDANAIVISDAKSVVSGLSDQFTFSVNNGGSSAIKAALLVGHYDTASYVVDGAVATKNYFNPSVLVNAGYPVDVCADDGTYSGGGKSVTFTAADTSKTIRSFHDYMRMNPRPLKGLQIVASGQNYADAWNSILTVSASSPFNTPQQKDIQLRNFFSAYQYQSDRVTIDFTANELEISDITMLFAIIPAGVTMTFNLRF